MLSHEAQVLKQGLTVLGDVLTTLEPMISRSAESPVSILLHEVASSGRPQQAMASMQLTPLLHGIVAAHAYVSMFLHVCKAGQVRRQNCIAMNTSGCLLQISLSTVDNEHRSNYTYYFLFPYLMYMILREHSFILFSERVK